MEDKYKSLAALKAAIDSGEIVLTDDDCIRIDNDCCTLYVKDPDDPDDVVRIFDGGFPADLLKQALDLLGIPNQPA